MLPTLAAYNVANICFGNTELARDGRFAYTSRSQAANFDNIGFRKFTVWIGLSIYGTIATLDLAILHILCLSTEPKMTWINARRIVATMANIHVFWDCAEMQFIRNAMGKVSAVIIGNSAAFLFGEWPCPQPTVVFFAFVYPLPKPLLQRIGLNDGRTMSRHVSIWLTLNGLAVSIVLLGDSGLLPTTTLAIAVWDFVSGLGRGMIVHSDSLLRAVAHATGRLPVAVATLLGRYLSNCTTEGLFPLSQEVHLERRL